MPGRKSLFEADPEFAARICERITNHRMSITRAFDKEGPGKRRRWSEYLQMAEAEPDGDGPYSRFVGRIHEAEADAIAVLRKRLDTLAIDSDDERVRLQATIWELENVYPKDFGKRQAVDLNLGDQTNGMLQKALDSIAETERMLAEEDGGPDAA